MARFGRQFLQQMASPSFGRGLFTVAQQIGAAPERRRLAEEQRKRMGMLRGMGAVERAEYMADIAKTPEQLMQATAAKDEAMRQSALTSLRGLEAARQAAGTVEEKQRIENIMSRVAVQAQVDPVSIAGRTQEEMLRETQLERLQADQRRRLETERSKNIVAAWTAMGEKDRALFKENLPVDDQVLINNAELQELEREKRVEEIEAWKVSKDAPLPVSSVEDVIDSLTDGTVKNALKADLEAIVDQIPEEGEQYSYAGQRSKLAARLSEINNKAYRAIVAEDSARITDERFDKNTIRQIEADIATYRPTKSQVEAKAAELEKAADEGKLYVFRDGKKPEDFEIAAEQELIDEYEQRQRKRLNLLVPSYERSEAVEETREFSSVEEALAAKLPKGTKVLINGREAVVE